ncbi:MAG: hypothetical protein PHN84_09105 [Desulfuromonadaceae bacterium]|nr:hypothetical protein [Desulfuromonadaceae bacterium]MDD2854488.1 hypothetical protein [Desulfuromonadaceae bacterium]
MASYGKRIANSAIVGMLLLIALPAVAATPTVEVLSFSAAKPQKGSLDFTGTQLKLAISNVGAVMKIDPETTKLLSFTDNKGSDLLAAGVKWREQQNYFTSRAENRFDTQNSSIDGNTLTIPVAVTAPPSPGATTVTVKGTIGLFTYPAEGAEKRETGAVPCADLFSKPLPLGEYILTLTPFGNGEVDGVLYTYANFASDAVIHRLTLMDEKNRELLVIQAPNPNENLVIESRLLPKIKAVSIQYGAPAKVTVPIEVTTGIGLI